MTAVHASRGRLKSVSVVQSLGLHVSASASVTPTIVQEALWKYYSSGRKSRGAVLITAWRCRAAPDSRL